MVSNTVFLCHHGGGRHWLSNLIWHLENNNLTVPSAKLYFDNQPQCSIKFETYFEYIERTKFVENKTLKTNKIVFFTNKPFNAYLNEAAKVQLNPSNYNLDQAPLFDKIATLLDTSRSWIKNSNYHDYYYNNIDLEYSLIFQDPEKFIDKLYNILDSINFSYKQNREYCRASIENYKKTCIDPDLVIGDLNNLYWLVWCMTLRTTYSMKPSFGISMDGSISLEDIIKLLEPVNDRCIDLTKSLYYFKWHHE